MPVLYIDEARYLKVNTTCRTFSLCMCSFKQSVCRTFERSQQAKWGAAQDSLQAQKRNGLLSVNRIVNSTLCNAVGTLHRGVLYLRNVIRHTSMCSFTIMAFLRRRLRNQQLRNSICAVLQSKRNVASIDSQAFAQIFTKTHNHLIGICGNSWETISFISAQKCRKEGQNFPHALSATIPQNSHRVKIRQMNCTQIWRTLYGRRQKCSLNPYPTAFPYGNGMVLHLYQQQESSTTKTVHKVINKGLKTYV